MEVLRGKRSHVVCFHEATPRIWALLQRSRDWFSLCLRPVRPIPGQCDYGAMILIWLLVRDTSRTPLPGTSQMRDIVEARLEAPWGGDIVVAAAHFDSPVGDGVGAAKAAYLRMAVDWVGNGGALVCAGDFNWTATDAEMGRIYSNSPQFSDLRDAMMPGNPGYTYNGVANMNAGPGLQGRIGRILRTNEVRAIARSVELVGATPMRKISRGSQVGRRKSKSDRVTTSAPLLISP